jgi:hypothetical protein
MFHVTVMKRFNVLRKWSSYNHDRFQGLLHLTFLNYSSSSSDFFGLDIIACSDVHWSAHLLVGLPGSLRPRGL